VRGYAALALDYYSDRWPLWALVRPSWWEECRQTIREGLTFFQSMPQVRADRIALVGFSQGALLATSMAGSMPAVKGVVSYYGGALKITSEAVQDLPPMLLIHGQEDSVLSSELSNGLYVSLVEKGKAAEIVIYPGVEHAFNFIGPNHDESATEDAYLRMLAFLEKVLRQSIPDAGSSPGRRLPYGAPADPL
jgi:carboxymethylenebutenolidase